MDGDTGKGDHHRKDGYTRDQFNEKYPLPKKKTRSIRDRCRTKCTGKNVGKAAYSLLPILEVMRKYEWRNFVVSDILAGLTVGIMHIPQGMGFGILASLTPIYGLYASFFPVLFYMIFGTSAHVSFGSNAVICLIIAGIVNRENVTEIALEKMQSLDLNETSMELLDTMEVEYKASIATALSFVSGLILLFLGAARLGFITLYMADSFISGFTTGAATHIATSQIPKMLAIKVALYSGPGKIIMTYIDLFTNITSTNIGALVTSIICIIVLVGVKQGVNERYKAKMFMPVPIDLIVVVLGTIISYFAKLNDQFGIPIVGAIPATIPTPAVPPLEKVPNLLVDSFVVAILIFAMTIAMAKLCSKKHSYDIDDNQELIAYGTSNIISSFFHCFPSATAPPRTMLASSMGVKTTFTGASTAALLLLVILAIGQLFQDLPVAVLAAMIVVAMQGLFMQVLDLKVYWKVNKFDFVIWLATCISVVFIDIDYGLGIGIIVSAFTFVIQSQFLKAAPVGKTEEDDMLVDAEREHVSEIPEVKIFKFESELYYANAEIFRSKLYKATVTPRAIKKQRKKREALVAKDEKANDKHADNNESHEVDIPLAYSNGMDNHIGHDVMEVPRLIIVDCTNITYIDIAGIKMLLQMHGEFAGIEVKIIFASLTDKIWSALEGFEFFDKVPRDNFYYGIRDALASYNNGAVFSNTSKV